MCGRRDGRDHPRGPRRGRDARRRPRLRRRERRKEAVAEEIAKLEKRLADLLDELFGPAASDYVRAAALEDERVTVEDRLMQLYEEEGKV